MAALAATGLVENLQCLGNPAVFYQDVVDSPEIFQRLPLLMTKLQGPGQLDPCIQILRSAGQVLGPAPGRGMKLSLFKIAGGASP